MLDAIFSGLLAGMVLSLFALGPSFFTLVKIGIHQNFQKGAFFASGILASDVLIVLLVYFGLSQIYHSWLFKLTFSLMGGVLVLVFGINAFRERQVSDSGHLVRHQSDYRYLAEGFCLNILNPFTFGLWIFVVSTVNQLRSYTGYEMTVFYLSILATIFSTDLFKTYLAHQTGKGLSAHWLHRIHQFIGIILILLSFRLLFYFLQLISLPQ
ncbi:MAG: LysE family transporter [Microscillaceae bacterium]